MKTYIVGGYVRDTLMGLKPHDRDFLLVGATPDEIQALAESGDYTMVGADFPVFLHNETREEYALARVERKIGVGYMGFECDTAGVTIEDDLKRRDLTINAMAINITPNDPTYGDLIDPYNGRFDIQNKVLRHVSEAFREDPLRIVRLARFYARFSDFRIAKRTDKLVREMIASGALREVARDRFWLELRKTLTEGHDPVRFVEFMLEYDVWEHIFPIYARPTPEIIDAITYVRDNVPASVWDMYIIPLLMFGSVDCSVEPYTLRIPARYVKALKTLQQYGDIQSSFGDWTAVQITDFIRTQKFKTDEDVYYYIEMWDIINKFKYPQFGELLTKCVDKYMSINGGDIASSLPNASGREIGDAIHQARVDIINKLIGN